MVYVHMRVGDGHRQDVDYLSMHLGDDYCLSELRTLFRALRPKYISLRIIGDKEGQYLCTYLQPMAERDGRNWQKPDEITINLTLEEMAKIVCEGRAPLWLEHRWLCHPNRECSDGCDAGAIQAHLTRYQR